MKISGSYFIKLNNPGKKTIYFQGKNLVVSQGEALFAQIVETNNGSVLAPTHAGVGTSGTAVDPGQTNLQGPSVIVARGALTETRLGNVLSYAGTLTAGGSNEVIREMGIFNHLTAGQLFARFLPQEFTLEVGGTLAITWALTFGD